MNKFTYLLFIILFLFISCSDVSKSDEGTLNHSCYDNHSCEEGLICNNKDICIKKGPCDDKVCQDNSTCEVINNDASCRCNTNFHKDNGICVSDIKKVDCKDITLPENAEQIKIQVDVVFNGESWGEPTDCKWRCNEDFTKDGNICKPKEETPKIRYVKITQPAK